jgi:hypothetical protein
MSLSTDVLARATPTRLICRAGRWTLELTRLEAVDRDVFQPRLTRLEGSESILAALRRSEEGQHLASGAAQLMRGPRSEDDRAFEVSEGDWVPSADTGSPQRDRARDPEAVDMARAVAELRAELAVLRASHARLRDRVIGLEAAQSGLPQPNARAPRGSRAPRRRSEPPPGFAEAPVAHDAFANNPGFAATQASPGLAAVGAGPGPAPPIAAPNSARSPAAPEAPQALPPGIEEMARALLGEQRPAPLNLPSTTAISECLTILLGHAPQLERADPVPFDMIVNGQLCKLLDDEGRERGAISVDLTAAVMLGAALLALPREEAARQVRAVDPSEDALLATSEICNNLTGPVNAVSGNVHVRSTALVALTASEVEGLPEPRHRLDLLVEGGRLIFAMF